MIEQLEKSESILVQVVETAFYIFLKVIKISKFTIGLSFFTMDYVITHCIVLTNQPATGVCTIVEQSKSWFIERITEGEIYGAYTPCFRDLLATNVVPL